MRPNPIAISELKILGIRGNKIEVLGVDVYDGTPLLDIKKQL
jgi:tRNA (Thr-GGU) A37 N-methylase